MCIEREQPSTAFKPMPQITTSNNIASKAVIHPNFQTEGDGFMKLGDIKGEFASAPEAIGADALALAVRGPLSRVQRDGQTFIEGPDGQLLGPISGEGVFKPQAIDNQAGVIVDDNRFSNGIDPVGLAVRGPLSDMTFNANDFGSFEPRANEFGSFEPRANDFGSFEPRANDFGSFEPRANEFGSFEPQVGDIPVQQVNGSIAAFEPTDSLVNFAGADAPVDTEQEAFSGMNQGFTTSPVNELRSDNRFVIEPMETITSFGAAMNASPEIGALTGLNASMIDPGGSPTFAQAPITDGLAL